MSRSEYDVAIIGGGIVGCAVLFELTNRGFQCVLLEKNSNIMSEASAGNSGMLHTGFDSPLGSVELSCIRSGHSSILDLIGKFGIPHRKCGAILVAWTPQEAEQLPKLKQHASQAGVEDVSVINPDILYNKEASLRRGAHGGLHVPGETVLSSGLLGIALAHHAKLLGAKILTDFPVSGYADGIISSSKGTVTARLAMNCAGLHGDILDRMVGVQTFNIHPRKGQYCVYGKGKKNLVNSMIMPMPTPETKGIAVFKTVYDNVVIGPTAQDVPERSRPRCDPNTHHLLVQKAEWTLPDMRGSSPIGQYSGLRPATQFKDYQICCYPSRSWLTVGGIRSTGVSGSLGIAHLVAEKVEDIMHVKATRGPVRTLEPIHWTVGSEDSVVMDGCTYQTSHPIWLFGKRLEQSQL